MALVQIDPPTPPEPTSPAPAGDQPATPADGSVASGPPARLRDRLEPGHLFLLAIGLTVLALAVGPISDIDAFWHVLIGQEILTTHRVGGLGNAWSLYAPGQNWTTSQWGSEVVMAWTYNAFGWAGILWLRVALLGTFLAALAVMLLRRSTPLASTVVFTLVVLPTYGVMQERPMLASFLLLVWLSAAAYDLLTSRQGPRWFIVLGVVALWANLHGMWVLAPATFVLIALALLLDRDPQNRPAITIALRSAGIALVAGCLTPLGAKGLLLPFTFRSATSQIGEWQVVRLLSTQALGVTVLVLVLVVLWIRNKHEVPRSQVAFVIAWFLFGITAYRNLLPAALMVAPLAAAELGRTRLLRARPAQQHERQALAVVAAGVLVIGLASVGWLAARTEPLGTVEPLRIAEKLATIPGDKRVLNSYNTAGPLVALSGNGIAVAIDGRSDRFGGAYIEKYTKALDLKGPWRELLAEIDPNYAVITTDTALTYELTTHQGWTSVMTDGSYSLLKAPQDRSSTDQPSTSP